ncbi:sulfite exporter TauE/SafE family protein [Aliiglaciecola sp. LCG003]|uniref:sulfite exporter TauE/SafE family protein n=1 Tax=Aliiglaciecola sp. LCG003 TaxID=3053655 RepID=UPI0025729EB7|nr:sulfite exporter TauE/SafE family protein [Aliiglaciecola sp. LCG003]WJG07602.1 sulfite exporter TauE/SafE family protein [Aliiglaciecola sp. LCG003]
MTDFTWFSALLIGLAGSVHCAGMCGGIVTSFTFMLPAKQPRLPYLLAYNLGRISSYTFAGALAGYFGVLVTTNAYINPQALSLIGGILMLMLALYIGRWSNALAYLEKAGAIVWRRISPLSKRFIPFKSPLYALPYGMIWGWLPCGLVYSTLTWSVSSGSAISGALTMFCFGLGTLPVMLAMGASANSIKIWLAKRWVRHCIAMLLFIFGLLLCHRAIHNW